MSTRESTAAESQDSSIPKVSPAPLSLSRRVAGKLARGGMAWLGKASYRHAGGEQRPVFFDIDKTCPELRAIDRNFATIRKELQTILPRLDSIPRYHEVDATQEEISNRGEQSWRVFFVYMWGHDGVLRNADEFPETVKILKDIPCVLNAFFSILEPGKGVPAHEGPSYHYLRYHTGFVVPKNNPPTIRVHDQYHTWQEGVSTLFDDSWEHEVNNESDGLRVVLIVDLMRPVSFPLRVVAKTVRRLAVYSMNAEMEDEMSTLMGFRDAAAPGPGR